MFGKRQANSAALQAPDVEVKVEKKSNAPVPEAANAPPSRTEISEEYYETKATIFNALFETIDVSALAGMQPEKAREEIRNIVDEIIAIRNVRLSVAEQNQLITEILVVFVTHRTLREQLVGHVGTDGDIGRVAIAF